MRDPFKHAVMGEYESEERWWIFPRRMFIKLVAVELSAFFMVLWRPKGNTFLLVAAIILAAFGLLWAVLSVIKRNPTQYRKGGGVTYMNLIKRRIRHRVKGRIYVLGIKSGAGIKKGVRSR